MRGSCWPWVLQGAGTQAVLAGVWAAAICLLRSGAFYKVKGNKIEEEKKNT